jgi:O-antigen ligase
MTESARHDETNASTSSYGVVAVWLERVVVFCLFAFAFSAPHSIAAAEGVWTLGMLAWTARFAFRPRPRLRRTPLDYALLGFFVLTFLTSFFSYEPDVSIGKLRAASLFTIAYLAAQNIVSRRMLRALVITLVASCMINVAYTFAVFARGHGVKIVALGVESPLYAAGVREGDTLLEVDRVPVRDVAGIERALRSSRATRALMIRWPDGKAACYADERVACVGGVQREVPLAIPVARGKFLDGATAETRLGVARWTHGRDGRASGFYGQYQTYSEVLQLIGSLAFGLLVALAIARRGASSSEDDARDREDEARRSANAKRSDGERGSSDAKPSDDERRSGEGRLRVAAWIKDHALLLLVVAVAGIACALLLTVTRASWVAFLVSIFAVVLAGVGSRRAFAAILLTAVVVVPVGLFVLRERRGVGFVDQRDESTTWRETVWREGARMLVAKPRHLFVGVGMDSLKYRWREWGMFDNGRLPWGHLHSTPLQIAFERGLPALAVWLALLFLYCRMLWRLARRLTGRARWIERGLALGALGGGVGFFTSGLVHYNLGDSEVAMTFYFIMGLALTLERLTTDEAARGVRSNADKIAA